MKRDSNTGIFLKNIWRILKNICFKRLLLNIKSHEHFHKILYRINNHQESNQNCFFLALNSAKNRSELINMNLSVIRVVFSPGKMPPEKMSRKNVPPPEIFPQETCPSESCQREVGPQKIVLRKMAPYKTFWDFFLISDFSIYGIFPL